MRETVAPSCPSRNVPKNFRTKNRKVARANYERGAIGRFFPLPLRLLPTARKAKDALQDLAAT